MADDRSFDLNTTPTDTHAFVQWKGTDVCMDFRCDCGVTGHIDGYFVHVVHCRNCGQLWEMPMILFPRKSQRNPAYLGVAELDAEPDEES